MKKTLLIAVALCCMMPLMAQKNNDRTLFEQFKEKAKKVEQINQMRTTYTDRLDSIVYSYGDMMVLAYDQSLNCTQLNEYILDMDVWELARITDYEYDAQNRVISIISTEVGYEEYGSKMTYEYDGQGRVSIEHIFSKVDGEWLEIHQMHHVYDVNGLETETHMYVWDDENNQWLETQKSEYTYNNGLPTLCLFYMWDYYTQGMTLDSKTIWEYNNQHCTKTESFYWDTETSDWILQNRTEYTYYNNGNVEEAVFSRISYDTGEMDYSWRTQYEYDSHDNVTKVTEYNYDTGGWVFDQATDIEYDLAVSVENVAGFSTVFDVSIDAYFKNKVTKMTNTHDDGIQEFVDFYYTSQTGVGEDAESIVNVWPNPTSETLNLKGDMTQVEIFSMDGRLVMSLSNGFESINVSKLTNGSYLLKATMKDGSVATQKFLKK